MVGGDEYGKQTGGGAVLRQHCNKMKNQKFWKNRNWRENAARHRVRTAQGANGTSGA